MEKLDKRLKEIDGGVILDVATGRGEFVHAMLHSLKSVEKVIGIDTEERMLKAAEEHFKDAPVELKVMNAEELDFEDNSFDMVCISNSLHHMPNLEKVLSEMYRVLKPEGYFMISEMTSDEGQSDAQKSHIMMHHWTADIDKEFGRFHGRTFTSDKINEISSTLNLSEKEYYIYSYPMENPKDEKFVEHLTKTVDFFMDKIKESENYDKLEAEGKKVIANLQDFGYAPAKTIFIIGKK